MKLKTKFYLAAALLLMLLGHFIGRIFNILAIVTIFGLAVVLLYPVVKRFFLKKRRLS